MSWLKNHLIPHKNNNFRPQFLYGHDFILILIVIFIAESIFLLGPVLTNKQPAEILTGFLTILTNEAREKNNLPDLVVSPVLTKAATLKARDMAVNGYFAHTSPNGKTPWYWLDLVGYKYDYAGENLAVNFADTRDVTDAWMNSPSHRANIVKKPYREVGSGIATGTYEGKESVFVVQVYANPVSSYANEKIIPITTSVKTGKIVTSKNYSSSSKVLGASIGDNIATDTLKVVSKNTSTEINTTTVNRLEKQGIPFWKNLFISPRHFSSVTLFTILGFISVILLLTIFINFRICHWDLIRNGLVIILLIISLYLLNLIIASNRPINTTVMDYSIAETGNR